MKILSLDFETSCSLDLTKVGASKYSQHSDLTVTVVAWAVDDGEMQSELLPARGNLPTPIKKHIREGGFIAAWNASFEIAILRNYFNIDIDPAKVICTQQRALYQGLPASLGAAGAALHLDTVKDKTAEALMRQMSKPRKGGGWWHEDDTEKLERLRAYCEQDVRAERAISDAIGQLPNIERKVSLLDRKVNDYGVRIDISVVNKLLAVSDAVSAELNASCEAITQGAVTNPGTQRDRLISWLGPYAPATLSKEAVVEALKREDLPEDVRRVLELRQLTAKSSVKKLKAALNAAENDDAIRGMLTYYGASRTGRWSGKGAGGFQPQNLPRPTIKDPNAAIQDLIAGKDLTHHGSLLNVVASCLRGVIIPRDGYKFAVLDLSQIEARVLAWVAGQDDILKVFAAGEDVYTATAKKLGSDSRTLGKVLVLACGYGMGYKKFIDAAKTYGLTLTEEEAKTAVTSWREANPRIVSLWRKCETAVRAAIDEPNARKNIVKGVSAIVDDARVLKIRLPNTRELFYRDININEDNEIEYAGTEQKTKRWGKLRTYSGKLCENIIQSIARDCIAHMALQIDKIPDAHMILSIHDEIIAEIKSDDTFHLINDVMNETPAWADGLPIAADGFVADRYGKSGHEPSPRIIDEEDEEMEETGPGDQSQPLDLRVQPRGGDQGWGTAIDLRESDMSNQQPVQDDSKIISIDFKTNRNEQALVAALELAKVGIKVFPCQADKTPVRGFMWKDNASSDPDKLRKWFLEDYPATAHMVGMPTGLNNLIALDPDVAQPEKGKTVNGLEEFYTLIDLFGVDTSNVPVVVSPTGGRHYIFAMPDDRRFGNDVGALPHGIDVRGDNGYLIAVGSQRADGKKYEACPAHPSLITLYAAHNIPTLPKELGDLIGAKKPRTAAYGTERMSRSVLVEALKAIPNDAVFASRNPWVHMCCAIFNSSNGADWGREAWLTWNSQIEQEDGEPEHVWDTLNPEELRADAGFIRKQLERVGAYKLLSKAKADATAMELDDGDAFKEEVEKIEEKEQIEKAQYTNAFVKASFLSGKGKTERKPALVKGLITATGLTYIIGQPSAGKSALSVKMAVAIATGTPFAGRKVTRRKAVIYIAAEAAYTIQDRIDVCERFMPADLPIMVMPLVPNLMEEKARQAFVEAVKINADTIRETFQLEVGAIFIDTLARAFSVSDENSAGEMGGVIRAIEELMAVCNCAGIVVHHMGKDARAGGRGSSAQWAAVDDELRVFNEDGVRHLQHFKSRAYRDGADVRMNMQVEEIGHDEDGDPITSVRLDFEGELSFDREANNASTTTQAEEEETNGSRLLLALHDNPNATLVELGDTINIARQNVHKWMKKLEKEKYVRNIAGKWVITGTGKRAVRDLNQCANSTNE